MKTKALPSQASEPEANPVQNLAEALVSIKDAHAGCHLAAYGDLSAQLVLRSEPAGARPQEDLDAFCRQARAGFDLGDALANLLREALAEDVAVGSAEDLANDQAGGAAVDGAERDPRPTAGARVQVENTVLALVPGEARVFVRGADTCDDALFLACERVEDALDIATQANAFKKHIQSAMAHGQDGEVE